MCLRWKMVYIIPWAALIEVTTIFLYSRLNSLITVHQISEDFPLSWLDTPVYLSPHRSTIKQQQRQDATLGVVIIPSVLLQNSEWYQARHTYSFTIYKLQPDLSIRGEIFGL